MNRAFYLNMADKLYRLLNKFDLVLFIWSQTLPPT